MLLTRMKKSQRDNLWFVHATAPSLEADRDFGLTKRQVAQGLGSRFKA